jgi:hypothetical protein
MWRLLLILSALPLAAAMILRWWFGSRVLSALGPRVCRCDLGRWMPSPDDSALIHRAEESADEFGRQLRLKALAEWREQDPKAAASRESSRRFGMAVPPLSGLVAVFAVILAKIPFLGAAAVLLTATALAAAVGLLSLAPELRAIARSSQALRKNRSFTSSEDEEAVVACAVAHAWKESLPPILKLIHG